MMNLAEDKVTHTVVQSQICDARMVYGCENTKRQHFKCRLFLKSYLIETAFYLLMCYYIIFCNKRTNPIRN